MLPRVTRKGEERVDAFLFNDQSLSQYTNQKRVDIKKESVQSIGLYTDSFLKTLYLCTLSFNVITRRLIAKANTYITCRLNDITIFWNIF